MNDGVRLLLMIGPGVPVPVPRKVLEALTSVKVTTSAGQASGFELTFTLSNRSPLHTAFLLTANAPIKVMRVVIAVTVRGKLTVLMDGVMTHHTIVPAEAGQSTITVHGEDLTRVMGYKDFSGTPFPNMPIAGIVATIIGKYAGLGIIPKVIPPILFNVPIATKRIPKQDGDDLRYIRLLAKEVGYVFYLDPGPAPGTSRAYFGPEIKIGIPQHALNTNMDAHTNVESLSFSFDADAKKQPTVRVQIPATKMSLNIPLPDISPLNPPLGLIPPLFKSIEPTNDTAKLTAPEATLKALGEASRSADSLTGTGTLNVMRYGRPLLARKLVGVRGAGAAFDGLHFVQSVTHHIKRGEYTQDFTLKRNALLSNVPVVRP